QASASGGSRADAAALAQARDEMLVAEGSDWFWWYGDDHSSANDLEFDDLFRRHVRNVYRLLHVPAPGELFVSNISTAAAPVSLTEPTGLLTPTLDGEETSYFEWLGAGTLEVRDIAGAMHQIERRASLITSAHFGFDREHLFVRVDGAQRVVDLLAGGRVLSLIFVHPAGIRFSVRQILGRLNSDYANGPNPGGAVVAAGSVLEVALPLADLGLSQGQPVAFFIAIGDGGGTEIERHPEHRPIELTTPDAMFEARYWRA